MPRPKFEKELSVMKVRKNYAAPYLKHKFIYLERKFVRSEKIFIKKMNTLVHNWPDGVYYLKQPSGRILTRFRIRDGKVAIIFKSSPATGEPYIIWEYFKK